MKVSETAAWKLHHSAEMPGWTTMTSPGQLFNLDPSNSAWKPFTESLQNENHCRDSSMNHVSFWFRINLFWGFFQFVYWANGLCSMTSSQMWLSGVIGTLSLSADFLDDWTLPSKESPSENPLQMLIPIDRYWPIPMTNTCVENQQNRIQTNYGQYMYVRKYV